MFNSPKLEINIIEPVIIGWGFGLFICWKIITYISTE